MKKFGLLAVAAVAALSLTSTAFAADLIIDEPAAPMMSEPAPAGSWDGPYIGVFGGWAAGTADHNNDDVDVGPCAPDGCDLDLSGWLVGVDVGANFYLSDKVIGGLAADIAWSDVSGADTFPLIVGDSTNDIDWQGSIRGVLGFDGGAIMPYLTAGVAFAHANHTSQVDDFSFGTGVGDATHIGWTGGVGVAIAATENISINLEYRHSDFGDQVYEEESGDYNPRFGLSQDAVTVGVHFSM